MGVFSTSIVSQRSSAAISLQLLILSHKYDTLDMLCDVYNCVMSRSWLDLVLLDHVDQWFMWLVILLSVELPCRTNFIYCTSSPNSKGILSAVALRPLPLWRWAKQFFWQLLNFRAPASQKIKIFFGKNEIHSIQWVEGHEIRVFINYLVAIVRQSNFERNYSVNSLSSLLACYLNRLGEQILGVLLKYFWGKDGSPPPPPKKKFAHMPMLMLFLLRDCQVT